MIVKKIDRGPVRLCWQMRSGESAMPVQSVLPSSSYHLVYPLRGTIEIEGMEQAMDAPFIAPLLDSRKRICIAADTEIFGLHLDPVYGSAIFSGGLEGLRRNGHLTRDIFSSRQSARLRDAVQKPATFDQRVTSTVRFFEELCSFMEFEKRRSMQTIHHLLNKNENISFREISADIGYSMRWIQIKHKEVCGVTPCEMQRLIRFNLFINKIYSRGRADTLTALECGYYDQAHAIREFKSLGGTTPGRFARALPPINRILNYHSAPSR